jgi:hypothetical protein
MAMALTPGDTAAAAARFASAETRLAGRAAEHGPGDDMWPPAGMMPKLHSFLARAVREQGPGGAALREMPNLVLVAALHAAAPPAGAAAAAELLFARGGEGAEGAEGADAPLLAAALPALRRAVRHWASAAPPRDAGPAAGAAAAAGDVNSGALHALLLRVAAAAHGGCRAARAAAEVGAGMAAHIDTAAADDDNDGGGGGERTLVTQPAFSGLAPPCTLPEPGSLRAAPQRRSAEAVTAVAALAAAPGGDAYSGWREALHKLILLSFLERSVAAAAPLPLPPLLARLLGALRAARCALSPEDAERCLWPLPDVIAAADPDAADASSSATLVAALRAALAPLVAAAAPRHAWRPAGEYLPCGGDEAFALRALLTARAAGGDRRSDAFARHQLALRLQRGARHARAEALLAVALARSEAPAATELLRNVFASASASAAASTSASTAALPPAPPQPTDDDAWRLAATALVAAVARDGSCARAGEGAQAAAVAADDDDDNDAAAAAEVVDLTDVSALCAAARRAAASAASPAASALRAVAADAAAAALAAAAMGGPIAARAAARVCFLRRLLLRSLAAAPQLNAALFEACVTLTPPLQSPQQQLLSASAFADAVSSSPHHWPALLPLAADAAAALDAWGAAGGGEASAAAAAVARAAHAACEAHARDAAELLLYTLTPSSDADDVAGDSAHARCAAFFGAGGAGGEAAALLTWLLLTHAARLCADAALLAPRAAAPRRLARMDALATAAASSSGGGALAAAALRSAVALACADAAWCAQRRRATPPPAHVDANADANAGAKRRRRLHDWCAEGDGSTGGAAAMAAPSADDVLELQTAPLPQLLGDAVDARSNAAALAAALAGCAGGRAAALHVASRALLCCGGDGADTDADAASAQQQLAGALAAALDAHSAAHAGGASVEARAARRLCAQALRTSADNGGSGGACWTLA